MASIGRILDEPEQLDDESLRFMCDGFLLCWLLTLLGRKKVRRYSFDFSSLAPEVFAWAEAQQKRLYLVGSQSEEIDRFVDKLKSHYPKLIIVGFHQGYMDTAQRSDLIEDIIRSRADLILAGLGSGLQEDFLCDAIRAGYRGDGFTCGGFIRQTALSSGLRYYPRWFNKLGIRWVYRMIREPHTIKRYLLVYPINMLRLIGLVVRRRHILSIE